MEVVYITPYVVLFSERYSNNLKDCMDEFKKKDYINNAAEAMTFQAEKHYRKEQRNEIQKKNLQSKNKED